MKKNPLLIFLLISLIATNVAVYFHLIKDENKLGSSLTTIQGTDRLTDSRSTINTNFSNLNDTKIESSSSSIAAITTLDNLTSIGVLTNLRVSGSTTIASTLSVTNPITGSSTLRILGDVGFGTSTPTRALSVQGGGFFSSNLLSANLNATGTLDVSGVSTLSGGLITASTSISSHLSITGRLTASSTFQLADSALIGTTTSSRLLAVQGSALLSGNLSSSGLIATGTINFSCSPQSTKTAFIESAATSTTITGPKVIRASTLTRVDIVTQCDGACQGGAVLNLYHGTSRATSTGTTVFTDNIATNSTTTGKTFNSGFNDNTLAAGEFLSAFVVDASSTPVTDISLTLCLEAD